MQTVNRLREALGFAEDTPGSMHPVTRANCGVRSQNARSTLDVVRNVTVSLMHSTYPRKAMVFISNGFDYVLTEPSVDLRTLARGDGPLTACPNEDINAKEILFTLTELFQKARVSGVPVYTVPPTGLMAPEDTTRHGIPDGKAFRAETDFMHVVAENTGGRAFVGRSDMIGAMHELVDDNSSFYLLGYYPEPAVRDGKWHDVKISLVGHPEYHIRAKEGYTASAAAATAAAAASHTLEDALGAALPSGELVLRAFAAPVAATPHGMKVVVTVEVTEPAPPLGSKLDDQLQFGLVAIDHDGAIKANVRRAFHFIATPTASGDVAYVVNEIVDLPSQPLILRVAIASQALGKVGTIHVPLVVPDTHGGNLQIGGIVLGLVDAPREGALETVPIATLVPFQPTTTRTFAATDTLRVFDRLFWGSKDADADVTITVVGAASRAPLAVHVAGAPATATPSKREGTLAPLVPLAGLAHGEYTLRIEARIANGQTARRDVLFAMK